MCTVYSISWQTKIPYSHQGLCMSGPLLHYNTITVLTTSWVKVQVLPSLECFVIDLTVRPGFGCRVGGFSLIVNIFFPFAHTTVELFVTTTFNQQYQFLIPLGRTRFKQYYITNPPKMPLTISPQPDQHPNIFQTT